MPDTQTTTIQDFRRITSEIRRLRQEIREATTRLEMATDELSHLSIEAITGR